MVDEEDELSTIQRAGFALPPREKIAFALEIVSGPDRGKSFVLDEHTPSPVLVGQSPACTFRLSDREVSRRHASFEIDGQRLRIVDLGSTNGSFVEGVAVTDAYVRPEQTIKMGATTLRATRCAAATAEAPAREIESFGPLVGESVAMRRLYPLFERLAASPLPLVIEGETGTGKELLAEALHARGPRASGPFVVFDCTTSASEPLDAELFARARGGTLFFDEIGELDAALQPKLLRVLDRGTFDVRVVASSRRNLDEEVHVGRFREDLYHRLVVTRVELPPLRKRYGDIERLAEHFALELGGDAHLPAQLLSRWKDHAWPGNVRELRNAVARELTLGDLARVAENASEVPLDATAPVSGFVDAAVREGAPLAPARQRLTTVYDRLYLEKILAKHGGNVTRAAAAAGIERRYFQILRARHRGT